MRRASFVVNAAVGPTLERRLLLTRPVYRALTALKRRLVSRRTQLRIRISATS